MMGEGQSSHFSLVSKRIAAGMVDLSIELLGGALGSYFGAFVAALASTLGTSTPEEVQSSIWSGLGFGFAFWLLSVSFVNRVLIQGISRASLGKKIFGLEIVSSTSKYTWSLMIQRWLLSDISFAFFGAGYWFMAANREVRTLHDIILGTDVVEVLDHKAISVEYRESRALDPSLSLASRILVLRNDHAERPMAEVIQLPVHSTAETVQPGHASQSVNLDSPNAKVLANGSLAEVIELNFGEEFEVSDKKKAA